MSILEEVIENWQQQEEQWITYAHHRFVKNSGWSDLLRSCLENKRYDSQIREILELIRDFILQQLEEGCQRHHKRVENVLNFSIHLLESLSRRGTLYEQKSDMESIIRETADHYSMSWGLAYETCAHIWPEIMVGGKLLSGFSWYPVLLITDENEGVMGYLGIRECAGGSGEVSPSYEMLRTLIDEACCEAMEKAVAYRKRILEGKNRDLLWSVEVISPKAHGIRRENPMVLRGGSASGLLGHALGEAIHRR